MTTPYPVPVATEEPLGSVTRVLALSEAGGGEDRGDPPDVFTGACLPQLSGRIYGGQVVAQGMLAAAATLADDGDGERPPHSVHAFFMRGGSPGAPVDFAVERLHDGRSFSQRRTTASQAGVPILTMLSSFQERQEGADVRIEAPEVPRPQELRSALEIFRTIDRPPCELGESWTKSIQSHTSTSRWNHWVWSRVARLIPSLRQHRPWLRSAGSSMIWSHM